MRQKLTLLLYEVLFFIYLEAVLSLLLFGQLDWNFFFIILCSLPIALFKYLLSTIATTKINRILTYILCSIIIFLFGAQLVYFRIYGSLISFFSVTEGGQVFGFMDMIFKIIFDNIIGILLMILPLVVLVILDLKGRVSFARWDWKMEGTILGCIVILHLFVLLVLQILPNKEIYSTKNLYYHVHAPVLTAKKMGMLTMMRLDLQRLVFGFTESLELGQENNQTPVIKEEEKYHMIDIPFENILEKESNKTIKSIHEYIASQEPSKENKYTGLFQGKNLIVFVAEAFSTLAIREKETPTLYKLYKEGFQFENFYTPLYPVSTSDGEYITDTSLLPKEGVWSMYVGHNNYYPYSYANVFKELGYTTQSYHDHYAGYYHRDKYLLGAMNYDSYKACGRGLKINCNIWPESDLEMIKTTMKDYIDDDQFLAYYMTVSGHLNYTKAGNMMASKNWNEVKDLPYSEKAKGYIAANIEFDRALEEVLKQLEEAGKLEDTVIVISSDHYPYGLTLEEINELSTYKRDDNFEKHHMPLLIWSSSMKEPIKVEKYGSSLDVLPTVLNLFGVEYDSRLLMGRDILSDSEPLVIFSNRSWITDKGTYNAITKKFTSFDGSNIDEEYLEKMHRLVYSKFQMSRLILETDYYKNLWKNF